VKGVGGWCRSGVSSTSWTGVLFFAGYHFWSLACGSHASVGIKPDLPGVQQVMPMLRGTFSFQIPI